MITGEGQIVIARSAEDILEFVLDLEQYRRADNKFGTIKWVRREGNHGSARYSGRLRGLPTPAETQDFELDPYRRLTFTSRKSLFPGALASFKGEFLCSEVEGGTLVVHSESFTFRPPGKWILEPFLRTWLAANTIAEMDRLKEILEREPAAGRTGGDPAAAPAPEQPVEHPG